MAVKHITILVASSGKNVVLAEEFERCIADAGVQSTRIHLDGLELPLYTAELEKTNPDMPLFSDAALKVQHATGIIVCAPEYNGVMPPALNNTIAWLSVQSDDFRRLFNNRTVLLATHSGGGGAHCLMAMRHQFSFLGSNVIGRTMNLNKSKPFSQETMNDLVSRVLQR